MTTTANLHLKEPISQAEIMHLARAGVSRYWQTLVIVTLALLIVSMALTASVYALASLAAPSALAQDVWTAAITLLRAVNLALFFLVFATQALLTFQALMLASDAIARERHNGTWDLLILTERGARTIVLGKWRAVRAYLFHTYRGAILLRAVVVLWLGISALSGGLPRPLSPTYNGGGYYYGTPAYGQSSIAFPAPDLLSLSFASALVLCYSFLDVALAAAVGLASAVQTKRGMAFASAGAAYIGTMLLLFSPMPLMTPMRYFGGALSFYIGRLGLALTPLDGGAVLAFRLVSSPGFYGVRWLPFMQRIALNLALMVLIMAALLWVAQRLARHQGARLEPRNERRVPSKSAKN